MEEADAHHAADSAKSMAGDNDAFAGEGGAMLAEPPGGVGDNGKDG